jgi:hypothetical protein
MVAIVSRDLLILIAFIAAYLLLNRWILPKLGVPT